MMNAGSTKNRFWWINPNYKVEAAAAMDGLATFPAGSIEVIDSREDRGKRSGGPVSVENGAFASLAALLFMINGHRPGPISGFYVVVEAVKGKSWTIGQMHADSLTPLRVFSDHLYDSEADARRAAETLRLADVGNAPPRA
jgi:hypothetical protein